jgi:hypothetical protein
MDCWKGGSEMCARLILNDCYNFTVEMLGTHAYWQLRSSRNRDAFARFRPVREPKPLSTSRAPYRDAQTLEEEQGVNILFLAIGFLRWFEDERSEVRREAPLVLVPVSLVRNNARSRFRLVGRDDDIAANLPLQERLKQLGINLPSISDSDSWTPSAYFASVRRAISVHPRWSVDDSGMLLGFFSFSKFLMFRDLASSSWPGEQILGHPILAGLLADGFPALEPLFPEDVRLDEKFDPADLVHVVDADSSQTVVIETVRRGRNLTVQGPPGTGKSQTIANLIAAAVHDGKRVLFVAEKMAALDVVYDRLVKAGLRDACLELHSRKANKKAVIQEIERTLRIGAVGRLGDTEVARLRQLRAFLNDTAERLQRPLSPSQVTPYQALLGLEAHHPDQFEVQVLSSVKIRQSTTHRAARTKTTLGAIVKWMARAQSYSTGSCMKANHDIGIIDKDPVGLAPRCTLYRPGKW